MRIADCCKPARGLKVKRNKNAVDGKPCDITCNSESTPTAVAKRYTLEKREHRKDKYIARERKQKKQPKPTRSNTSSVCVLMMNSDTDVLKFKMYFPYNGNRLGNQHTKGRIRTYFFHHKKRKENPHQRGLSRTAHDIEMGMCVFSRYLTCVVKEEVQYSVFFFALGNSTISIGPWLFHRVYKREVPFH